MKRGQKGFTVVETLLVLILLAILGFTGYYVYHTRNNTNNSYNNATNSSSSVAASSSDKTYNGDGFTLKYPSEWKFTASTADSPDDKLSLASSASSTSVPFIDIVSGTTTYTKAADDWPVNGSGRAGTVSESKSLTINSYSAFYVVTTFDYAKEYTYDIVHNGKAVNINLEKPDNDTTSLSVLDKVAKSIQFK
jgi:prepilin-type N-terminal cleavage/methylation domain-containing protein